jgi:putative Mg2+ transporter-C (MgtC) family protein
MVSLIIQIGCSFCWGDGGYVNEVCAMTIVLDDVIKLLLALLVGGLIGAEREFRDKAAGFRTIIFICVGATLFTLFSIRLGGHDPVRIAANIVSGVGFLGAGAILRGEGRVVGLTTASTIWLVAALGMGIGGGHYLFAGVATGVVLVVLWVFPRVEGWIGKAGEMRTYHITCSAMQGWSAQLDEMFRRCDLRVRNRKQHKRGDEMICIWEAFGRSRSHARLVDMLLDEAGVREFYF